MKSHGGKWLVLQAACCLLWAARAGAQPEDRTHPLAVVPPVVVAPVVGVAPLGAKAGDKEVAAVGLSASAVKMPLLVAKLRSHQVTPQEAWAAGDLEVPDLIFFLESLDRWGGFFWDKDIDLRRQMVALLVEHGQKQLEHPEGLSPVVRLWLADYYQSLGDAKCLTLCESILSEQKEPQKGENALVFQTLERMAWFYRDQGQPEKGAQAWLRVSSLIPDEGWWQPDALIEAARLYYQGGKQEEAQQLYKEVPNLNNEWSTSIAIHDQTQQLISKGQNSEAQFLLKHSITSIKGEESRSVLLSLLAWSQYKVLDFRHSRNTAKEALKAFYSLPEDQRIDHGINTVVGLSQRCLEWVDQWEKQPLVCWPRDEVINPAKTTYEFNVRTFPSRDLSFQSPQGVEAHLEGSWQSAEFGFCFDSRLVVSVQPELLQTHKNIVITLTDKANQNIKDVVTLHPLTSKSR